MGTMHSPCSDEERHAVPVHESRAGATVSFPAHRRGAELPNLPPCVLSEGTASGIDSKRSTTPCVALRLLARNRPTRDGFSTVVPWPPTARDLRSDAPCAAPCDGVRLLASEESGGGGGIRTPGGFRHNGFQDRRIRPLCHPSAHGVRLINRGSLSPRSGLCLRRRWGRLRLRRWRWRHWGGSRFHRLRRPFGGGGGRRTCFP